MFSVSLTSPPLITYYFDTIQSDQGMTESNSPSRSQPPMADPNRSANWDIWVDGDTAHREDIAFNDDQATQASLPVALEGPSTPPLVLVETAFLASTSCLLWLINYYFPIGPVLQICFPIPLALVYLRWGSRAGWMSAWVASLLLSVLMGPARSILFLLPFGFLGVLLGACWRRRVSWPVSLGLGTLLGSIGFFFRIWFTSILLGEDLWIYVTTQVTDFLDWLFLKLGLLIQPELSLVQALAVVAIVANSLVYLFAVHLLAWILCSRLKSPIPPPPLWIQNLADFDGE